ncbi:hypothetical protein [Micromonospora sp. NPDC126480]|uniref:hypothetical protein n=1 Tax=Micromonospora sp. NPDC126480 TaxID=3155312 RepID=UPI00332783DE
MSPRPTVGIACLALLLSACATGTTAAPPAEPEPPASAPVKVDGSEFDGPALTG